MKRTCQFVYAGPGRITCTQCGLTKATSQPPHRVVRRCTKGPRRDPVPVAVPTRVAVDSSLDYWPKDEDGNLIPQGRLTTDDMPCPHRGAAIRTATCDICVGRGELYEVFACEKFKECSLIDRKAGGKLRSCFRCPVRLAAIRTPLGNLPVIEAPTTKPKRTGPVRVVFFSPGLLRGGAERWIVTLCKTWHGDVRATGVVLSDWAGSEEEFTDELGRCGVSVVASQNTPQKAPNSPAVRRFPTTAEAARSALAEADVVISWGWGSVGEVLKEAGWTGPHIVVSHGACEWSVNLLAAPARGATHLAAVSEAAVASFPPDLQARVRVMWNGIEADRAMPSRSRDEVRAAWGCGPDDILIGYVGRMAVSKRPEAVAEAVAAMRDKRQQAGDTRRVLAVLVGDGTHRDLVQAACRKAAGDDCLFIPPPDHIGDAYNALDGLVLASPSEGMALVLCEAWAAGVPTVATPVGAIPELEREFGQLATIVPVGASGAELAEACEQAMSGATHHARSVALREFSAARMARRWADWLGEIIHAS